MNVCDQALWCLTSVEPTREQYGDMAVLFSKTMHDHACSADVPGALQVRFLQTDIFKHQCDPAYCKWLDLSHFGLQNGIHSLMSGYDTQVNWCREPFNVCGIIMVSKSRLFETVCLALDYQCRVFSQELAGIIREQNPSFSHMSPKVGYNRCPSRMFLILATYH